MWILIEIGDYFLWHGSKKQLLKTKESLTKRSTRFFIYITTSCPGAPWLLCWMLIRNYIYYNTFLISLLQFQRVPSFLISKFCDNQKCTGLAATNYINIIMMTEVWNIIIQNWQMQTFITHNLYSHDRRKFQLIISSAIAPWQLFWVFRMLVCEFQRYNE